MLTKCQCRSSYSDQSSFSLPLLSIAARNLNGAVKKLKHGTPTRFRRGLRRMYCSASNQRLKIVFVATEVAPWSKVGGLGDVMAALPVALAARGHQVMTVAPAYKPYPEAQDTGKDVLLRLPPYCGFPETPSSSKKEDLSELGNPPTAPVPLQPTARLLRLTQAGVERVFVEHSVYDGLGNNIYGSPDTYLEAGDSSALDVRASVLCQAALAAPVLLWGAGIQRVPSASSPIATSAAAVSSKTATIFANTSSDVTERAEVDVATGLLQDVEGSPEVGVGTRPEVEDSHADPQEGALEEEETACLSSGFESVLPGEGTDDAAWNICLENLEAGEDNVLADITMDMSNMPGVPQLDREPSQQTTSSGMMQEAVGEQIHEPQVGTRDEFTDEDDLGWVRPQEGQEDVTSDVIMDLPGVPRALEMDGDRANPNKLSLRETGMIVDGTQGSSELGCASDDGLAGEDFTNAASTWEGNAFDQALAAGVPDGWFDEQESWGVGMESSDRSPESGMDQRGGAEGQEVQDAPALNYLGEYVATDSAPRASDLLTDRRGVTPAAGAAHTSIITDDTVSRPLHWDQQGPAVPLQEEGSVAVSFASLDRQMVEEANEAPGSELPLEPIVEEASVSRSNQRFVSDSASMSSTGGTAFSADSIRSPTDQGGRNQMSESADVFPSQRRIGEVAVGYGSQGSQSRSPDGRVQPVKDLSTMESGDGAAAPPQVAVALEGVILRLKALVDGFALPIRDQESRPGKSGVGQPVQEPPPEEVTASLFAAIDSLRAIVEKIDPDLRQPANQKDKADLARPVSASPVQGSEGEAKNLDLQVVQTDDERTEAEPIADLGGEVWKAASPDPEGVQLVSQFLRWSKGLWNRFAGGQAARDRRAAKSIPTKGRNSALASEEGSNGPEAADDKSGVGEQGISKRVQAVTDGPMKTSGDSPPSELRGPALDEPLGLTGVTDVEGEGNGQTGSNSDNSPGSNLPGGRPFRIFGAKVMKPVQMGFSDSHSGGTRAVNFEGHGLKSGGFARRILKGTGGNTQLPTRLSMTRSYQKYDRRRRGMSEEISNLKGTQNESAAPNEIKDPDEGVVDAMESVPLPRNAATEGISCAAQASPGEAISQLALEVNVRGFQTSPHRQSMGHPQIPHAGRILPTAEIQLQKRTAAALANPGKGALHPLSPGAMAVRLGPSTFGALDVPEAVSDSLHATECSSSLDGDAPILTSLSSFKHSSLVTFASMSGTQSQLVHPQQHLILGQMGDMENPSITKEQLSCSPGRTAGVSNHEEGKDLAEEQDTDGDDGQDLLRRQLQEYVCTPLHPDHYTDTGAFDADRVPAMPQNVQLVDGGPIEELEHVVVVANDWQTAPLLLQLKLGILDQASGLGLLPGLKRGAQCDSAIISFHRMLQQALRKARSVFCIHNLAYQGRYSAEQFWRLCLPVTALDILAWPRVARDVDGEIRAAAMEQLLQGVPVSQVVDNLTRADRAAWMARYQAAASMSTSFPGGINWMQGALLACNKIVTVSPNYASEIQNDQRMGCDLADVLKERGVTGIMNGIDTETWNPETDVLLPSQCLYNAQTVQHGKAAAKAAFQERFDLVIDPNVPLFACIGRLADQKGIDVLLAAMPDILGEGAQLPLGYPGPGLQEAQTEVPTMQLAVLGAPSEGQNLQVAIMGTGSAWMATALQGMGSTFKGKGVGLPVFDEQIAHLLLAAADYVLVPSRFEPCGLVAQSGCRYGAIPVVTSVGGLKDLVTEDVGIQMGVLAPPNEGKPTLDAIAMLKAAILNAVDLYRSPTFLQLQQNCMALDVSWSKPAAEWEKVLLDLF
eukprot:jgi/Botrbrau1/112/Bobra.0022s0100.2